MLMINGVELTAINQVSQVRHLESDQAVFLYSRVNSLYEHMSVGRGGRAVIPDDHICVLPVRLQLFRHLIGKKGGQRRHARRSGRLRLLARWINADYRNALLDEVLE